MMIIFLEGVQLAGIKNKFSEFNLFYKYLTQKPKILKNRMKITEDSSVNFDVRTFNYL